ncbi:MAG: hypothetical protein ACLUOF_06265 [Ruminococcus sp.]
MQDIKLAYMDIVTNWSLSEGRRLRSAVCGNRAGILYNKDMFEENGWEIPTTWSEFTAVRADQSE